MAAGDMTREDQILNQISPGPDWIGVGMVGDKRAVLRAKPAETGGRTPYLVQYDVVAILQRHAGWARVRFLGSKKQSTGWLRETKLAAFTAWPTREARP